MRESPSLPLYTQRVVKLSDRHPFAVGGARACYVHPDHPGRCIKIMLDTACAIEAIRRAGVTKQLNPDRRSDYNECEHRAYQKLEQRRNPEIWRHIPRCHGWIETDLGRGLVFDFLGGPDGVPAPNLLDYVTRRGPASETGRVVDEFKSFLVRVSLRISDLNLRNLVLWTPLDSSCPRIYLVDGLGDAGGFLWSEWMRPFWRWNIRRKIARLDRHLARLVSSVTPP
jgi:hypothetical protein